MDPLNSSLSLSSSSASASPLNCSFGQSPFSEHELQQMRTVLALKLGPEYVSQRAGGGAGSMKYLEGWKATQLANEVFGFNGWANEVKSCQIDFVDENENGKFSLGLSCVVRVTLRDGTFHEDVGYGISENNKSKGNAFEKAKKEAVTDAIKRCLKHFGNVLGNCLYDKDYLRQITRMSAPQNKPLNTSELYHSNTIAQMSAKTSKLTSAHATSLTTESITPATNPPGPQLHKSHTLPPNLGAQSPPNNSASHDLSKNVVTNNVSGTTHGNYVNNLNPTAKGESSDALKNGQRESSSNNDPTKNQKWSSPPNLESTAANTISNNTKNSNTTNQSANSTSMITHNKPAPPDNKINNQNSNFSTATKTTNATGGFTAIPQQYKAPSNPSLSVIPPNGNTVTGNQQTRKSNPSVSSNYTSITSVSTSATVATSTSTSTYNSSTNFTATSINTSNNSYSKSAPNITAFNPAGMKPSSASAVGSSGNRQLGVGIGHSGTDESAKGVVGETAEDKFSIGVKRKTGENDAQLPPRPNVALEQNQNQTSYTRPAQSIVDSTSSSTNAFLRNSSTHSNHSNHSNHSVSKSFVNVNYNQSNNYSFNRHGNGAGSGGMGGHGHNFPGGTVGTNIGGNGIGNSANMGENRQYGYGNKRVKGDN